MKKRIRLKFFSILFFLIWASCKNTLLHENIESTLSQIVLLPDEIAALNNESNSPARFQLHFKEGFFDNTEILYRINTMPEAYNNEPDYLKAYRFVIENIDYIPSLHSENFIHHPLILINSIGYGQCDDLASALVFIWRFLGYEARVWNLGGHVVPEIFVNGKWKMIDPSFQVYFLNDKYEIAGVEELSLHQEWISNPFQRISFFSFNNADTLILDSIRHSSMMQSYYATTADNEVSHWYDSTYFLTQMQYEIPPKAKVYFPFTHPSLVKETSWFYQDISRHQFLKIELNCEEKQTLKIPHILVAAKGKGTIYSGNTHYEISSDSTHHFLLIDTLLQLQTYSSKMELYFLYNLKFVHHDNTIFTLKNYNSNQLKEKKLKTNKT